MKNLISRIINAIEYSFKYQYTNSNYKYGSTFQGFFSFILSPLVIPLLLLIGYNMDLKEAVINDEPAPRFNEYERLIKEGLQSSIVYLPIVSILILSIIFGLYVPPILSFSFMCLYIWPAVSLMYAIKRDYKKVYSKDLIELITSKYYLKTYIIFTFFLICIIIILTLFSLFTLGIGLLILLPCLIYIRPVFWGYIYKNKNE